MMIFDLFFLPLALFFAILGIFTKKRNKLWRLLSYSCFFLPILVAFKDIVQRSAADDAAGIYRVYSIMVWLYLGIFILITVINISSIYKEHRQRRFWQQ